MGNSGEKVNDMSEEIYDMDELEDKPNLLDLRRFRVRVGNDTSDVESLMIKRTKFGYSYEFKILSDLIDDKVLERGEEICNKLNKILAIKEVKTKLEQIKAEELENQ